MFVLAARHHPKTEPTCTRLRYFPARLYVEPTEPKRYNTLRVFLTRAELVRRVDGASRAMNIFSTRHYYV